MVLVRLRNLRIIEHSERISQVGLSTRGAFGTIPFAFRNRFHFEEREESHSYGVNELGEYAQPWSHFDEPARRNRIPVDANVIQGMGHEGGDETGEK